MARPKKEINWDLVEKLMEAGCSAKEICGKFRIDTDTFYLRFKENYECGFQDYSAKAQGAGMADIRMMQHAKAINNRAPGNSQMLMHLGKVRLGQKEIEDVAAKPPNLEMIHLEHENMRLKNALANSLEGKNGNEPETRQDI